MADPRHEAAIRNWLLFAMLYLEILAGMYIGAAGHVDVQRQKSRIVDVAWGAVRRSCDGRQKRC